MNYCYLFRTFHCTHVFKNIPDNFSLLKCCSDEDFRKLSLEHLKYLSMRF